LDVVIKLTKDMPHFSHFHRLMRFYPALWNTLFYVGTVAASIVALALFSGNLDKCLSLEWLRLAAPVLLQWLAVAGVAGACSGVLTGLWCRFTRQTLLAEGGTVSAPN
jgi:hypothetical protein